MIGLSAASHARLLRLLSCSTAPFREAHVVSEIETQLKASKLPYFFDPHGNIVLGVNSEKQYRHRIQKGSKEPLRVFIAHMDHPGFHGVKWLSPSRLKVKWLGGSPVKHVAGSRVWIATDEGQYSRGTLRKVILRKTGRAIDSAEVQLDTPLPDFKAKPKQLYGGFEFSKPVLQRGKRLYTRAADDLAGVFAIIETAKTLGAKNLDSFIGLLTRGEEVGFVGAVAHLDENYFAKAKRPIVCVSLEASRTLPGAIVGKGPVVRLGDWRTVFNADGLKVLSDLAEKLLPGKHQRRIMDGGSCEATAATAWGMKTIGISIPLGNYHNEGYEGGIECPKHRGPAPEFVHLDDIAGEVKLCRGLMRKGLAWQDPWQRQREILLRNAKKHKPYL